MAISTEQLGPPIDLRAVFTSQRAGLICFLEGLESADWQRSTACDGWTVADLLAHILGGVVGRVSGARDQAFRMLQHPGESLEQFIDRINGEWVVGCRRLSPQVMIELLSAAGPAHDELWTSLDGNAPSLGVSWAGIDPAPVWFDAARDVTEYWVHERQLRDAVGHTGLGEPGLGVVLDVFARGLPHTLAAAELGDLDCFSLVAESADVAWTFERSGIGWSVVPDVRTKPKIELSFDGEFLWQTWTRQAKIVESDSGPGNGAWRALRKAVVGHVAIVHSAP